MDELPGGAHALNQDTADLLRSMAADLARQSQELLRVASTLEPQGPPEDE